MRRDVAHTLAVSDLAAELGKRSLDFIAFDEAFRTLDVEGITAVVGILKEKARSGLATILVAEHNDDLDGMFENHVWAQRKNGATEFVVE